MQTTKTNFQLGSIYALVTAALLATQEPFSALAAKRLPPLSFVCLTQAALLLSVPILIARARSRHDFSALLLTPRNLGKLAVLFLIGIAGLLLYNLGLRNAHPIIVAAILNLSPFWAAIVAKVVSGKAIPISSLVFWPCFSVAFIGRCSSPLANSTTRMALPLASFWTVLFMAAGSTRYPFRSSSLSAAR